MASLPSGPRALYVELARRFTGSNNGALYLSQRDAEGAQQGRRLVSGTGGAWLHPQDRRISSWPPASMLWKKSHATENLHRKNTCHGGKIQNPRAKFEPHGAAIEPPPSEWQGLASKAAQLLSRFWQVLETGQRSY
ncbi:hypothetical protein [Paracoccus sp. T5]|uniref:hypothetical protein n=1 Tax=Paracoccus sp. T5 TaxID=3402161 RepID=UPI003ADEE8D5